LNIINLAFLWMHYFRFLNAHTGCFNLLGGFEIIFAVVIPAVLHPLPLDIVHLIDLKVILRNLNTIILLLARSLTAHRLGLLRLHTQRYDNRR
jgi:hypothetical protein